MNKMELTKKELQNLYNTLSMKELCYKLNVTHTTIYKLLRDNKISKKSKPPQTIKIIG